MSILDSVLDAFALFLTAEMKDLVVTHMNQKAEEYYQKWNAEHNDNKVWNILEPLKLDALDAAICWCSTISQRKRKQVVENGRLWTSSIPGNSGNRVIQSHNAVSAI